MPPARSAFSSAAWDRPLPMGADTFLLQWLSEPLDTGKLQLFTESAKELVAFIDRDRAAVGQDARST
jgi:hypothetical protein